MVVPGDPGIPSTVAPTRYRNFGPRIGFAYSPKAQGGFWRKLLGGPGNSSIRAGYGIYYTAIEELTNALVIGDPPFGLYWVSPVSPNSAHHSWTVPAEILRGSVSRLRCRQRALALSTQTTTSIG